MGNSRINPGRKNPGLLMPADPIDPEVSFISLQSPLWRPDLLPGSEATMNRGDFNTYCHWKSSIQIIL